MEGRVTQLQQIKKHLFEYRYISTWDAISLYGITRLAQYIYMMKKEGYKFDYLDAVNEKGKPYRTYILIDEGEQDV